MAPRERRMVGIGLGLLAFAFVWWVAVQPSFGVLRSTPTQIDKLDAQLQQMQRLAAESKELHPCVLPSRFLGGVRRPLRVPLRKFR